MIPQLRTLHRVKSLKEEQALRALLAKRRQVEEGQAAVARAEEVEAESRRTLPAREDAIYGSIIGRVVDREALEDSRAAVASLEKGHARLTDAVERTVHVLARLDGELATSVAAHRSSVRVRDKYALLLEDARERAEAAAAAAEVRRDRGTVRGAAAEEYMRGVGDSGRGGTTFGGDGEGFLGHAGSDDGAARRDAAGAGLGDDRTRDGTRQPRDPEGRDRRSEDFRSRLAGALDGTGGAGGAPERGDRRSPAQGPDAGTLSSGAAGLLGLFQPAAPTARPGGDRAVSENKRAGGRSATSENRADPEPSDPLRADGRDVVEPRSLKLLAASPPSPGDAAASWTALYPRGWRDTDVDAAEVQGTSGARLEAVAARIEEALRADAAVTGPVTIRVPMDPGLDGLAGVSVTVTAGGLDVVLDRVPGADVSDGLAAAAQDLVGRLQKRFPRGSVRVLEAGGLGPARADSPLQDAGWTRA